MAEVIEMGKRTLGYNPIIEYIKNAYSDDLILIDAMFTWEVDEAIKHKKSIETLIQNKRVEIDGVGWRNTGHKGYIDLSNINVRGYVHPDYDYQVTKITEGCPNNCPYCYSGDFKVLGVPEIKRNHVKLTDENLLAHPEICDVLETLRDKRVNGNVVYYEAICGFEKQRITPRVARHLKDARFENPRIAWDEPLTWKSQKKVYNTIRTLVNVGYDPQTISVFILTNWEVAMRDCFKKLNLLKVWNVKVNDCCYNCNYDNPIPYGWTLREIRKFRREAREHNQIVRFKIYPEGVD